MIPQLLSHFAVACGPSSTFLGFPTWYEYLPKTVHGGLCSPQLAALSDVWLIVAAIIEILLRISSIIAVGFVMYGGFLYITSQGEPDKTSHAKNTIVAALVGLIIAVISAILVGYIAGKIS